MFKIDDFFKIFDYINGKEDVDLESSVKVLASSELAKTNLLFENTIDQSAFSSSDYRRLRKFLIHLYATHRTLTTIQKDASKLYFLPSEHIDELCRSFGFKYSYNISSITNKVNFFLDLVNIYKRKGSPSSLVSVLRYFGVYDSNIVEYFLQRDETDELIFEPYYIESELESPTLHRRTYHDMVDIDPHWFQTEDEIKKLHDDNIISLPSKSPFLGIGPHIRLNDVNLLISYFRRIIRNLLDDYLENDNKPVKDINIGRFDVSASILDLYLAIAYIIFQLQNKIYDPDNRNVLFNNISDDIGEEDYFNRFNKLVDSVERDNFEDKLKEYREDFTIPFSELYLDSTSTTETLLSDLNPTLKSEIDGATDLLVDVLSFLSRDLSDWLNRNIEIDAPNIATIISGFAESIGSLKDIINFVIPYRVRFLPLSENLLITDRLFNTIFAEEKQNYEIEQTVIDLPNDYKDYDESDKDYFDLGLLHDICKLQLQQDIEDIYKRGNCLNGYDSGIDYDLCWKDFAIFNIDQIPSEQLAIEERPIYEVEQLVIDLPNDYKDYDESDNNYHDLGLLHETSKLQLKQDIEDIYKRGNCLDGYDSGMDYDLCWNDFAILNTGQISNEQLAIEERPTHEVEQTVYEFSKNNYDENGNNYYDLGLLHEDPTIKLKQDIEDIYKRGNCLDSYDSNTNYDLCWNDFAILNTGQISNEQLAIEEKQNYEIEHTMFELPHDYKDYDENGNNYYDLGLLHEDPTIKLQQDIEDIYKRDNCPNDYDSDINYDLCWKDFAILTTTQLSNLYLSISDSTNCEFIQKVFELPKDYRNYDSENNYDESIINDSFNLNVDSDLESNIFRISSGYEDSYEYEYETNEEGDVIEVLVTSGFFDYDDDVSFDEPNLKQITEIFVEEV